MPLPKVQRNVQDQNGNIVTGVLGSVYNQGTGVLASLYQDDAGATPLSNPMTNDATYGSFKFYINPGHYDMTFTKPGYTFEPVYDFQVPEDAVTLGTMATQNADAVAITGGTAALTSLTTTGQISAAGTCSLSGFGVLMVEKSGDNIIAFDTNLNASGGTNRYTLRSTGTAPIFTAGPVQVGGVADAQARLHVVFNKSAAHGLAFLPNTSDTGRGSEGLFKNGAA